MLLLLPLVSLISRLSDLGITLSSGGGFDITVDGVAFAEDANIKVVLAGVTYTNKDGTLKQASTTNATGADPLGSYAEHRIAWIAGTTAFETAVRVYTGSDTVVFEQHWPHGATGTAAVPPTAKDSSGIVAGYPALALLDPAGRGYLAFGGRQLETCFSGSLADAGFNTGDGGGGPLSIFDRKGRTLTVTVASEFMSTSWGKVVPPQPSAPVVLASGTVASMTTLPAGFKVLTMVVSGTGPTASVVDAGTKLLTLYGKNATASRAADLTLSTLGVSTDNGAYYYGHTEAGG